MPALLQLLCNELARTNEFPSGFSEKFSELCWVEAAAGHVFCRAIPIPTRLLGPFDYLGLPHFSGISSISYNLPGRNHQKILSSMRNC